MKVSCHRSDKKHITRVLISSFFLFNGASRIQYIIWKSNNKADIFTQKRKTTVYETKQKYFSNHKTHKVWKTKFKRQKKKKKTQQEMKYNKNTGTKDINDLQKMSDHLKYQS